MNSKNKKMMSVLLTSTIISSNIANITLYKNNALAIDNEFISKDINSKENMVNNKNLKILNKAIDRDEYISRNNYGVISYSYENHNSGNSAYKYNYYNSIIKNNDNTGYIAGGFLETGGGETISYIHKYSSEMSLEKESNISKFKLMNVISNQKDRYLAIGSRNLALFSNDIDTIISYDSDLNIIKELSISNMGLSTVNNAIYHNGYYYIMGTFTSKNVEGLTSKGGSDIALLKFDVELNLIGKVAMGTVNSDKPYVFCVNEKDELRIVSSNTTNLISYDIDENLNTSEKITSLSIANIYRSSQLKDGYYFVTFDDSIHIVDSSLNTDTVYKLNIDFNIEKIIKKDDFYYIVGYDYDSDYSILKTDDKFNIISSHTLKQSTKFGLVSKYTNIMEDDDNIIAVGTFSNVDIPGIPDDRYNTRKAVISIYDEDLNVVGETPTLLGYTSGDGTKSNPYIISSIEELNLFRKQCELRITGNAHFKLGANIDLSNFDTDEDKDNGNWTPITYFAGTFDGGGYTISNISVNTPENNNVGLFSIVTSGTIKNLTIENIKLSGYANVGSVVSYLDYGASIENVTVKNGDILATGTGSAGGIVGGLYTELDDSDKLSVVKNCNFNGKVSGSTQVGGIVGYAYDGNIIDCNANAEIIYVVGKGSWKSDFGGIIGCYDYTEVDILVGIENCSFEGVIKAKESNNVGGIAGSISNRYIKSSSVIATIEGNDYLGGVAGTVWINDNLNIEKTSVVANINGNNYVAGLIGKTWAEGAWNIQNNYTKSIINAKDNASGFISMIDNSYTSNDFKSIQNNYTASTITSNSSYESFVKYNNSLELIDIKNNYYDEDLNSKKPVTQLDGKIVGLKTAQMKGKEAKNNMEFDFTNIWKLNEEDYPTLNPTNTAPIIIPNDKVVDMTITINQYEKFNPLDYVIVEDFEDDEVEVIIKENIDTSRYGLYKITYVATDSGGLSSELELNLKINPLSLTINNAPVIIAEDITLTVGDTFIPLEVISAFDKEDGVLTLLTKVVENTVNTNKAGEYKVTYEVTDKDGARTTKTIKVTVKDKIVSDTDVDKDNNNVSNTDNIEKPQTRDIGLVGLIGIFSSIIGLSILNKKEEK